MSDKSVRMCGMVALWVTSLSVVGLAQDNPVVNGLFGDHMVLQRGMPVPVWGTCKAGTKVTVRFGTQEKTAEAGTDGRWMVKLDALNASSAPAEMTITSATGNTPKKIVDILVGDVWLCSGQSNMEMQMESVKADDDIAQADYPPLRHCWHGNGWVASTPKTVGSFTATGFYFGRRIHRETGIPVGLLNNSIGGTSIETWIPPEAFEATAGMRDMVKEKVSSYRAASLKTISEVEAWLPSARAAVQGDKDVPALPHLDSSPRTEVNSGFAVKFIPETLPLIPYAIKGMIWYQGEANGGDGDVYTVKLSALITGLRKAWNEGDFPVYFVQLPNGGGGNANPDGGDGWAKIRMAQFKALALKNTGMAVTIDTSETGDIHPFDKLDVGNRLAQLALAKDYGKNFVASGPLYKSMKVEGNEIRVSFENVGKGLMIGKKNGKEPLQEVAGGKLEQFAIAQSDAAAVSGLKWYWADAVIDGATVVVSSLSVTNPVAVHYAYTSNPLGNKLYNKDGLPASPFRTND